MSNYKYYLSLCLCIKNEVKYIEDFINHYLNPSDTIGCYWLDIDKNDNRNYSVVILSEASKRLIVYNVVN